MIGAGANISPRPRTIVLWDIDNTLLYTGGAGSLGMARAFHDLYGIPDAFSRVEFSGRSDTAIFREAARAHGVAEDSLVSEQARFIEAYLPHLGEALRESNGRLMPGVVDALDALEADDGVVQGLGTGNFRVCGGLKLTHYGIGRYFPGTVGGFGDDAEERAELILAGIGRLTNGDGAETRVVIIGDTPHDVAAAKANGAVAIAVATGRDSVEALLAYGADVAFTDLSDTARVLAAITGSRY